MKTPLARRSTIHQTPSVDRIRLAAVPAQHPYVRAVSDPETVTVLPDPLPPGAEPGRWWPPQVLDEGWLVHNAARFDVLHLHFGAESYTPEHVAAAFAAARRAGKPIVHTVHDLQNPQLASQEQHERMLDVVVPSADVVITLTDGARAEIAQRWGRDAIVIAHPRLGDAGERLPIGNSSSVITVGTHLRDLRPNIDAVGVASTLVRAVAGLRAAGSSVRATLQMNERVRDEDTAVLVQQIVAEHDGIDLVRGPRLPDEQLLAALADLDACILPYAYGTHSGWLELCHDLAVPVVGPSVGHYRDQHPAEYARFDIGDPVSLAAAIERATTPAWSRPGSAARAAEVAARAEARESELAEVRAAHTDIYRSLVPRAAA
ncbi:glycosyltransferase [Microbacterium sp. P04]|uniref:glycosyltransferase n=1 Tax=Microbacterium sp. P04 TaxID=3366947 RepID=UPI003745FCA9